MDKFEPMVSIVIPVYNGANYMCEAIDSALAQTYKNIEILVINDGSVDDTEEIALSYGNKIRYFSKPNGGVATALNMGIEKMRGEYFSWLSHDDLYFPEKIEKQVACLRELDDKTILISCPFTVVDETGREFYRSTPFDIYTKDELSRPLFALLRGQIGGCCLLIHRSHFERYGKFDPTRPTTQDFALWFEIMRENKVIFVNDALIKSRSHEEQGSKALLSEHVVECNVLWIGFMQELSDDEMCAIDGSVYNFFKNTYGFLFKNSGYDRAIPYAEGRMLKALGGEFKNSDKQHKKHLIKEAKVAILLESDKIFDETGIDLLHNEKKKPRIMFYIGDRDDKGGLARVLYTVSSYLCDKYEVIVVCDLPSNGTGLKIDGRIKILNVYEYQDFAKKLAKLCCLFSVDIFVNPQNCWAERLEIIDWLELYKIKSIAWNHEAYFLPYWNQWTPTFFQSLPQRNERFKKADVCVWLTSASAKIYSAFANNAAVMNNPLMQTYVKVDVAAKNNKNIIAVARFDDPLKGLDRLILVFADILKKVNDTKLFVVGVCDLDLPILNQSTKTYRQLIKELKIPEKNLMFTGWTDDPSIYYKQASVHILPSYYEGFGLVILEAAAYGLPSIVFDGSGYDDIIDDGINGFIVPRDDIKTMGNVIVDLLSDDTTYQKITLALPKLLEKFKSDDIKKRWEDLIETTLNFDGEHLCSELKEKFMPSENIDEKTFKLIAEEYENAVQRLLVIKEQNSTNIQQPLQNVDTQNNIDVQQLLKETHSLVSNIQNIYSGLLIQATQPQIVAEVIESPISSHIVTETAHTTHPQRRRPFRRLGVRVVRKLFRATKRLLIALRLKRIVTSTKFYKKMRIRGVIDKLNRS